MDRRAFAKCNTILDVYAKARQLKEKGEDPQRVNQLASLRKKELISQVNKVCDLRKVLPNAAVQHAPKVTSLIFEVGNLNSNNLRVTKDNKIIL